MNWQIAPHKLQWNPKKLNQSNRFFERLFKNDRGNDLTHTMKIIRKGMVGWQSRQGKWWHTRTMGAIGNIHWKMKGWLGKQHGQIVTWMGEMDKFELVLWMYIVLDIPIM